MERVDVDRLHDCLLKAGDVEELRVTSEVNGEARENSVQNSQAHQKQADAVFVSFVEGPLGFDHASEAEVGRRFAGLLGVFVDTAHALVADVEHQAQDLRRLGQKSSSLDNIVVIKFGSSGVLVQLESSLDVSEVVVLVLEEPRDHFR